MNEPDTASAERDDAVPFEPPPRFLQFQLSSMFLLTLVVAVACTL